MHDMASKMAELKFEAPLAQFEEADGWVDFQTGGGVTSANNMKSADSVLGDDTLNLNSLKMLKQQQQRHHQEKSSLLCDIKRNYDDSVGVDDYNESNDDMNDNGDNMVNGNDVDNDFNKKQRNQQKSTPPSAGGCGGGGTTVGQQADNSDNFNETFSGSLEDLVNTFDEKITKCFGNYEESVENLAPVQVRTQEEIMNECQMWWTITGNFGNILPIDWSRSSARRLHLPALRLAGAALGGSQVNTPASGGGGGGGWEEEEDEAIAADLDMHKLILGGLGADDEPPMKTAEEVLREIDDLMDEDDSGGCYYDNTPGGGVVGGGGVDAALASAAERAREVLGSPLYKDKLRTMSLSQLNELYTEFESLIRDFSETLIAELALRDELDYDKELKNAFISLLLAVQNRRRQHHVERKRSGGAVGNGASGGGGGGGGQTRSSGGAVCVPLQQSKYLTTVIPYHAQAGAPDNRALTVLIKILKAINEDSPTVPTLLTDYILKVLCPT